MSALIPSIFTTEKLNLEPGNTDHQPDYYKTLNVDSHAWPGRMFVIVTSISHIMYKHLIFINRIVNCKHMTYAVCLGLLSIKYVCCVEYCVMAAYCT